MERAEMRILKTWKATATRKPMIIRGARQVGKTWLMKEFGRQQYEQVAYVNFESSANLKGLFQDNFDIRRILTALQIETGITIVPATTLLIFDEIQEAPGAISSLKYFQENAPDYHIVTAGSLLGVALNNHQSFPVGKVDFLELYPLSYSEFLEAAGEKPLAELLKVPDWPLITTFKVKFMERLKQYYFIGGMPEAVRSFVTNGDFKLVRTIQQQILTGYEQDFSKHAPTDIIPRIRMLWNSIPAQLAKENKKFIYGLIRSGARAKEYELAMSWLIDCGLIHKVHNISHPGIPLKAFEELSAFKLFLGDVGLLSAMTGLDVKTLLDGNDIFETFKGALTEQYVLQQLLTLPGLPVYYWTPNNAKAEMDFVVQHTGKVIPIEVKAAENLQAKSLKVYCDKYMPALAVRASLSDYRPEGWMVNVPLYAIETIDLLASAVPTSPITATI
ncbi:ATP-binding protein [Flavitalea sp.]|nr:ATP-binding protein [Flavitalea sp.]